MNLGEEKNLLRKKLIFFVDKLNIIDFNIFNILKLIFTCEYVAYLLQNSFVNVRFQLNSIFFGCLLLWLSLWGLVSSLSALFCVVSSRHFFTLFPEIKAGLIFWGIVKLLSRDASKRLEIILNFVYHLSWILWCIDLAQHCD